MQGHIYICALGSHVPFVICVKGEVDPETADRYTQCHFGASGPVVSENSRTCISFLTAENAQFKQAVVINPVGLVLEIIHDHTTYYTILYF